MDQSKDIKPVIIEDKTARLRETVSHYYNSESEDGTLSPEELRKAEIIRKMREDNDMKAYPLMLHLLLTLLIGSTLAAFITERSGFALLMLCVGSAIILIIRYRLKTAIQQLYHYKNDFSRYVWEGYYIKEMRHNAVKLLYILLFPVIIIFCESVISGGEQVNIWIRILLAFLISTPGWLLVFEDDRKHMKSLRKELLEVLPYDPENPDF
jgi:positive regulator of sigma E activity